MILVLQVLALFFVLGAYWAVLNSDDDDDDRGNLQPVYVPTR